MPHQTANVMEVQRGARRFCERVCGVDNFRNVAKDNVAIESPLLNDEVLYIDMPRTWRRSTRVDDQDCRLVIRIELSRARLHINQLKED